MSLINDALKKAQQKRAEELPPSPPAVPPAQPGPVEPALPRRTPQPIVASFTAPSVEPPPPHTTSKRPVSSAIRYNPSGESDAEPKSRASRGNPAQKLFWVALAVIAVAAIIVRLAVTAGRNTETAAVARQTPSASASASHVSPQAELAPLSLSLPVPNANPLNSSAQSVAQVEQKEPAVVESQPTALAEPKLETKATPPANEPPPVVTFKAAPVAAPKPVAAKPETAPIAVAAPTIKPDATPKVEPAPKPVAIAPAAPRPAPTVLPPIYSPRAPTPVNNTSRVQSFIDRLRVTGVRISDSGSKVILNDRLFGVGEMVDSGLELKLVKIEPGIISFIDPTGKKYVKLYQ